VIRKQTFATHEIVGSLGRAAWSRPAAPPTRSSAVLDEDTWLSSSMYNQMVKSLMSGGVIRRSGWKI
jgi:hypothetical protein